MTKLGNTNIKYNNASEEFKKIAENITIVIWKAKVNKKYEFEETYISPIIDEILELPKGTIKNDWNKFFKYVKPEYLPKIKKIFQKAFMSPGTTEGFDYQVIKANGKIAYFHSTGRCSIENGQLFVFGTTADITQQKETEKALRISEKRLKEAQKIAHIGHWELDYRTNEFLWSDEIFNIYEIEPFKCVKKYEILTDKIHTDDKKYVFESFEKALKNKIDYNIIHRLHFESGKIKYVNQRCRTIYDEKGNPKRSVGTIADITQQIENDKKIKRQNIELKTLNAEKDIFFSIISHDLKSPFNALLGFSELLKKGVDKYDKKKIKQLVSLISQTTKATFELLEDLLNWANLQQNKMQFNPKTIDLYDFTRKKIKIIENIASTKAIKIENKIEEKAEIFADENMLSTIFRNLLTNAIKFTHKGGEITIFIKQKTKK